MKKCEEILNSEIGEIFIHCIGNAINRGINLALKLKENSSDAFSIEANTSTITLIGNYLSSYVIHLSQYLFKCCYFKMIATHLEMRTISQFRND